MKLTLPHRILMTSDTVGGVWNYSIELCRALQPYCIEIMLATMGPRPSPSQLQEVNALSNVSLFASTYKLEWMQDPWTDVSSASEWLLDLENRFGPDLLHLNNYAYASLPWQTPKIVVAHSCVLSWWRAVKGSAAPTEWDYYKQVVHEGLLSADLVVAPSNAMLASLEENYGPLGRATVIPNGRSGFGCIPHSKEPIVLAAGRLWDEAKNVGALKAIASSLSWPVYLAGHEETPGARDEDSNAIENAAAQNIRFLGLLSSAELNGWMTRAALYVLPARYEPFGLSILEAALGQCALVLGDIPSMRENWENAAVFVPPEDHVQLRRTLEEMIVDKRRRQDLAWKAHQRALLFTSERMCRNYVMAYADLLQRDISHTATQEAACAS